MPKESVQTQLALMRQDITFIKDALKEQKDGSVKYVEKDEFEPIKKIVYGIVSVALLAVLGALVNLVVPGVKAQ